MHQLDSSVHESPVLPYVERSYRSITFITTYTCTAACRECCFECSPHLDTGRLDFEFMRRVIDDARSKLPNLQLVVFSGGECFMLKEHLYRTIAHAHCAGLFTRCVTNGYWGARMESALRIARTIREAGIGEINISTGLDHQEWVPLKSVVNCAEALTDAGIRTLITVEKDTEQSQCWARLHEDSRIQAMLNHEPRLLTVICNTWMPFRADSVGRGDPSNISLEAGCKQLFSNLVITPHKMVSACCGLTFEHIPELKTGPYDDQSLSGHIEEIASDFLKLWIHVDGPREIAKALLGDEHPFAMKDAVHICQACATLHQDPGLRKALESRYHEFIPDVVGRYLMSNIITQAASGTPTAVPPAFRSSFVASPC